MTGDIESMSFNTAISTLMIFANHLWTLPTPVPKPAAEALILLVSPFAPHMAEECWAHMGHAKSLAYHPWPEYDEKLCFDDVVKIGVQVRPTHRPTDHLGLQTRTQDPRTLDELQVACAHSSSRLCDCVVACFR